MNLQGFDYAYALSLEEVNRVLRGPHGGANSLLQFETRVADSGSSLSLRAVFSALQVVRGAKNGLLRLRLPLVEGCLSLADGALTGRYELSEVAIELDVRLGWAGATTPQRATGSGANTLLVFEPSLQASPEQPGHVAVHRVLDPQGRLDALGHALLLAYFARAVYANGCALRTLFASVNPAPPKLAPWLSPRQWIWHYAENTDQEGEAALCILGLMSDAPLPAAAFDPRALSPHHSTLVVLSLPMMFRQVLLPAMRQALGGEGWRLLDGDEPRLEHQGALNIDGLCAEHLELRPLPDGSGLLCQARGLGAIETLLGLEGVSEGFYRWAVECTLPLNFTAPLAQFISDPAPLVSQDQNLPWYEWPVLVSAGITHLAELLLVIDSRVNDATDLLNHRALDAINRALQLAVGGSVGNLAHWLSWQRDHLAFGASAVGLEGGLWVRGNLGL